MKLTDNNKNDLIELIIIFSILLLIVVIYVPVAIWEEEESFQKESRYRMENLYNVQSFYKKIIGEYNSNFFEAMNVINAARDSSLADSLFTGEMKINLNDITYNVTIDETFSFEYDTTFGLKAFRKDTVLDTTLQISYFSDELSRYDTSFIRRKDENKYSDKIDYKLLKQESTERVEAVEYYDTYIPDSSLYMCPLSNKPYNIEIFDDAITVSSPIELIEEDRYMLFTFKATSHGFIKDGRKSWD